MQIVFFLTSHSFRLRRRGLWPVLQPATRDTQNVLVSVVLAWEPTDFYRMTTKKSHTGLERQKLRLILQNIHGKLHSLLPDLKNLCFWSTLMSPSLSACWAALRRACSSRDSVRFQDRTSSSRNCPLSEPLSL